MKVHYVLMLLVMLILGAGFIPWYMDNADAISGEHDGVILAGELGTVGDDFNLTFRDGIDTETLVMEYYDGSDYYTLTAEQAEQFYTYYLLNNDDSQKLYLDGTINEDGDFEDLSGNGNHGTPYNGATTGTGVVGDGMSFDGTDYYCLLQSNPKSDAGIYSFATWVYCTFTGSELYYMNTIYYDLNFDGGTLFRLGSGTPQILCYSTGVGYVTYNCSSTIPSNTWKHLSVIMDENNDIIDFYIDGEFVNEINIASNVNIHSPYFTTPYIGNHDIFSRILHGNLDEIRIYDRALSSDENEVLYNVPVLLGTLDGYDLYASYEYTAIESSIDNRLFYITIPLFAIVIMLGLVFKLNN